ncbi:histidine--tRNA ligase [Flavobacteriaceae bacterium]|nr:histidine--tRNA ligase [Flavobacteriaceae bacterium]
MKPSIPKGTRDFSSLEVAKRNYLKGILKTSFESAGFEPIETPSFEKAETLLGKYGEEGDRLIFKILANGEKLKKADISALEENRLGAFSSSLSEKALRYDLTVPFARFVAQHQNDLVFPFKRYQIQPVWRADRPQHGRFQEFFQCDADVVGSTSLWQEVELCQLYSSVFAALGIKGATIKINNRKILAGIAEVIGAQEKLIDFTVALDKLDKIGFDGVIKELKQKSFTADAIERITPLISLTVSAHDRLSQLEEFLSDTEIGKQGIEELRFVVSRSEALGVKGTALSVDVTLARGLNYYTGCIFEVSPPEGVKMGSIGGGGRYDDLTAGFGMKNMSGVGISFGFDRIYLVLEELDLFPASVQAQSQILFLNFGDSTALKSNQLIASLRENGLRAEFYPDAVKMKKQLSYANQKHIPWVVLLGEEELSREEVVIKNMKSGEQFVQPLSGFQQYFISQLA